MRINPEQVAELEELSYQIRRLSVEMIAYSRWGHIGGSFSMAELLAVLYFHTMRVAPEKPDWDERDRLILSKAHGSPLQKPLVLNMSQKITNQMEMANP